MYAINGQETSVIKLLFLLIIIVSFIFTGCSETSEPAQTNTSVNKNTESSADIFKEIKTYLQNNKGKMDNNVYLTVYTQLNKIPPSASEYSESQQILKQYNPQIKSSLRNRLINNFQTSLQNIFSSYSKITVELVGTNGDYSLVGSHNFFTDQTFIISEKREQFKSWINKNQDELKFSDIKKVGIRNADGTGVTNFNVK